MHPGSNYYVELIAVYGCILVLDPVAYAICDVLRRLVVIISAVLFFHNPYALFFLLQSSRVLPVNALGIVLALCGVLIYNLVAPKEEKKEPKSAIGEKNLSTI